MRQIAADPNVEYVQPNARPYPGMTPDDTNYNQQWGFSDQGQWRYDDGRLVMIEEGISYPIDIVKRDATTCYSWCARTNNCERSWEPAKANGFENTREAYDEFCAAR